MSDEEQSELGRPETRPVPIRHLNVNRVEQQPELEPQEPALAEIAQPVMAPPEKVPFWGYNDLLLFIGLVPLCMLLGIGLIRLPLHLLHVHPAVEVEEALPEQCLGYLFIFGALAAIIRNGYGQPFWTSLGWTRPRVPSAMIAVAGVLTAFMVVVASSLIRLPDTANPMTELMSTRTAILLMAIFGTTVAPLCEELAFRGFLQPLLVRGMGAAPGILLAAIPFGLLHYQEYGNSWRHVVIISGAGAAFGAMRQATGSTKAAVLMHASYNAFFFLAIFSDSKDMPQSW
jgi:membrane protease YdiL (CAAX protease family)